jgi:hypothetical protein
MDTNRVEHHGGKTMREYKSKKGSRFPSSVFASAKFF